MRLFPDFKDVSLDTYQPQNQSQEEALRVVKDYVDHLTDCRQGGSGLTMIGPAGVGKTHLAEAVLKQAEGFQGFHVESVTVDEFIGLHQRMLSDDEILVRVQRIQKRLEFVLFDDLGREYESDRAFASSVMFNTIKSRSNRRLPFLITTNLSLEKMVERYTGGFVSLLHGKTEIIQIEGEDYRAPGAARH